MNTSLPQNRARASSALRRAAQYALGTGIVLSVSSAFGPIWLVRAGIAAAVLGGLLALRFAWRELAQTRIAHAEALTLTARAQAETLSVERERTGEVLDQLRVHNADADASVRRLVEIVSDLREEMDALRSDHAGLQVDLIDKDHRIKRLRAELAEREAELAELRKAEGHAEVLAMPRHAAKAAGALPTADEVLDERLTVVDIQKLAFPAVEAEQRKQA